MSAAARRPRRWRRFFLRALLIVAVLALVVRVALPFALPGVLRSWAEKRGLSLGYEELDIGVLDGAVELWHADLRPLPTAGEPAPTGPLDPETSLAHLEYFKLDASMLALFTGKLKVRRLEVDGVDALLRRTPEGAWELERYFKTTEEPQPEPEPAEKSDENAEGSNPLTALEPALALVRALEVSALRVQHLNVRVQDPTVSPPVDTRLELSVRVSDVGSDQRRTRLQVLALVPGVLDSLRVDGHAEVIEGELAIEAQLDLSGLHPPALAGYLVPLGLEPRAQELDLGAATSLRCAHAAATPASEATAQTEAQEARLFGTLELRDFGVSADLEEALTIDRAALSLAALTSAGIHLDGIELSGLTARAARAENGQLVAAGLALGAGTPRSPSEPDEPSSSTGSLPFAVRLDRLEARDILLALDDRAVSPATTLAFELAELSVANVVFDPAQPGERLELALSGSAPGIARTLNVEGNAIPFGARREAQLNVDVEGIVAERVAPHLAGLGLTHAFEDGAFRARVEAFLTEAEDGALVASAAVRDVALSDGTELLALDALSVDDVRLAPDETRVPPITVAGARARVERDADGHWHFLGLRTLDPAERAQLASLAAAAAPAAGSAARVRGTPKGAEPPRDEAQQAPEPEDPTPTADAATVAAEGDPHRFVLDSLALEGAAFSLSDRSFEPQLELTIDQVRAELEGLVFGGAPNGPVPPPARFDLGFGAEGLADELGITGTVASRPGPLDVEVVLVLRGRGLTARAVEPYLEELGLESTLNAAELDGEVQATARMVEDALHVDASLRGIRFADGENELAGLDAFELKGLRAAPGDIAIDAIAIERPRLAAARDSEGAFAALGLRLVPREPAPAPAQAVPAAPVAAPESAPEPAQPAAAALRFALGSLRLDEAALALSDAAVEPAVQTTLRTSATLDDLVWGDTPQPLRAQAQVALDGVLETLDFAAEVTPDPAALRVQTTVEASGLDVEPLAGYFPAGIAPAVQDGRLAAALNAESAANEAGGRTARFELRGFEYGAAGAAEPFVALESFDFEAPRLDLDDGIFELERLTSSGLTLAVRRTDALRFEALGLAFELPPAEAESVEPDGAATEDAADEEAQNAEPSATPAPAGDAQRRSGQALAQLITLGTLDLGIERFVFRDETRSDATAVETSVRLATPRPQVLLDGEPEALPPFELAVTAAALPIVGAARIDLSATPWAPEPVMAVQLDVSGIRGSGLTEALPELATLLDGHELDGGTFTADLRAALRMRRRSPTDFDLSNGFGLEAEVSDVAFRASPEGDLLAGVQGLWLDVASVRPRSGDVHVRTLEIERPALRVRRSEEGVHALGLIVKIPTTAEDGAQEAPAEAEIATEEEAVVASEEPATAPDPQGPEFRLDELLVTGVDFEVRDDAVEPPLLLPLADLDVEVKRFTTRALFEPRPIQLRAIVSGGEVPLPERDESGFLSGIASTVADAVGGDDDDGPVEQRPIFDEVALSGQLSLAPVPRGYVKVAVSALELPGFRGPAQEAGVEIGDGLLDTKVTLRFLGDQGMRIRSNSTFGYLSLSEAAGGPISRYLKLSAPLDVVLFALRNRNGEHRIPVNVAMPPGKISFASVGSAVATTLGQVIADALAGSPFRLLGSLTDLVGLTGGDEGEDVGLGAEIAFEAGAATVPASSRDDLAELIERLNQDGSLTVVVQHDFGAGDLARAEMLANPSEADCLALAARLRGVRAALSRERAQLAAEARAHYVVGLVERGRVDSNNLRGLDREIGRTEEALDRVYELLRPGAERRRDKRTRDAALALGQLRLEAVRDLLETAGIRNARARIDLRRPRYQLADGRSDSDSDDDFHSESGGRITLTPKRRR